MSNILNLVGQKFGRLVVIKPTDKRSHKGVVWYCLCNCGNNVFVISSRLRDRSKRSCGCLAEETRKKNGKKAGLTLGRCNATHKHSTGGKVTKEYRTWQGMKNRCFNLKDVNFKYWGGRGITVYEPWIHSFETFLQYLKDNNMYPKPKNMSIDRIDNDGNYEPGNIRWATQKEQIANQRHYKLQNKL
jgi:hypothetical protein